MKEERRRWIRTRTLTLTTTKQPSHRNSFHILSPDNYSERCRIHRLGSSVSVGLIMREISSSELNNTSTTFHVFLLDIRMRALLLGVVFCFFLSDPFTGVLLPVTVRLLLLTLDPVELLLEYFEDDLASLYIC